MLLQKEKWLCLNPALILMSVLVVLCLLCLIFNCLEYVCVSFLFRLRTIWNSRIFWSCRFLLLMLILWTNLLSVASVSICYFCIGKTFFGVQTVVFAIVPYIFASMLQAFLLKRDGTECKNDDTQKCEKMIVFAKVVFAPIYLRWKSLQYLDHIFKGALVKEWPSKVRAFYDAQQFIATVEVLPQLLLQITTLFNLFISDSLPAKYEVLFWSLGFQCGTSIILIVVHGTVFEIQTLKTHFHVTQFPLWTMTLCSFKMFCKYVLSVGLFGSTFGLLHCEMRQECWAYVAEYLFIVILVGCQFVEILNHLPKFPKSKLEHRGPRVLSKNIARIGFQLTIEASSTLMLLYVALSTCSKEDETNLNDENGRRALVALFIFYTSVLSVVHLTMKIIFRLHVLKERKTFFEFKYPKYSDLQSRLKSFPDKNEWKNQSEQRANEQGKNVADHMTNCSFSDDVRVDPSSRAIQVRNFQALSERCQSSESLEHSCGQNDGIISDKDRLIKDGHFFSSRWTDHKSLESTCFECGKINHPDFSKVYQQPKNPNDEIEKEMIWTTKSLSQGGEDFSNFALSFCVKVTEVEPTDSNESIINMKCPTCEHEEKYAIAKRSLRPCGYCDNSSPLSTKPASKLLNRSSFHLKAPIFLHNKNCPFRALVQERLANHCRHFLPPNRNQWPFQDFRIYDVVIALSRCYVISMLVLSFHWAGLLVGQRLWENCFIYGRILLLLLLSNITLLMDYALDHSKPSFLLLLVQLFTARGITFLKYVPDVLNSLYILYFGVLSLFLMGQTQGICDSNVMILSIVLVFSVAFNLLPIISWIKTECEAKIDSYQYDSSSEA